jgi:hypothetical protein
MSFKDSKAQILANSASDDSDISTMEADLATTTLYNAKIKAESNPKPSSKPSTTSSSKVAPAQSFNKSIAGTYKVKASNGLNLRYKPGDTSNSNLILTIPNGKSVANYGYYTTVNGVKWYLVTYKDTPGFVSSRYLVK